MPEPKSDPTFDRKMFVNIQGEVLPAESATVNAMDHGFLYGDSVYETIRTFEKTPFLLGRHLDRLQRSLGKIFMEMPCSRAELEKQIQKTIDEVPIDTDLIMRIVISRGTGPIGLDIATCSLEMKPFSPLAKQGAALLWTEKLSNLRFLKPEELEAALGQKSQAPLKD